MVMERSPTAQKTTKIGSDHQTIVGDLLNTIEDHREFGGRRWSPTGHTLSVTGLLINRLYWSIECIFGQYILLVYLGVYWVSIGSIDSIDT